MAQSGFTPISLYFSATGAAVPLAADLVAGELALNTNDGKLYFKNSSGVVTLLAGSSSGPAGGSTTQVQYNNAGVLAGITGATTNGTALTLVAPVLGTPASGVVTNLTGTASININGTVGATTANTGAFTTVAASGKITSTVASGKFIEDVSGTTSNLYAEIRNTTGWLITGVESSAGGSLITGGSAYAGIIATNSASNFEIGVNGTKVATFTSAGFNGVVGGSTPAAASVTTLIGSGGVGSGATAATSTFNNFIYAKAASGGAAVVLQDTGVTSKFELAAGATGANAFGIYDTTASAYRVIINSTGGLTIGSTAGTGSGALFAGAASVTTLTASSTISVGANTLNTGPNATQSLFGYRASSVAWNIQNNAGTNGTVLQLASGSASGTGWSFIDMYADIFGSPVLKASIKGDGSASFGNTSVTGTLSASDIVTLQSSTNPNSRNLATKNLIYNEGTAGNAGFEFKNLTSGNLQYLTIESGDVMTFGAQAGQKFNYSGVTKLETTSAGVSVTGTHGATGTSTLGNGSANYVLISGDATNPGISVAGSSTNAGLVIAPKGTGSVFITTNGGGGTAIATIASTGLSVTGTLAASSTITQTLNQNATSELSSINTTSGTGAQATFAATSNAFTTRVGQTSALYTPAGAFTASTGYLASDSTVGLAIIAYGAGSTIKFAAGGTTVGMTYSSTGLSVTGTLSATGTISATGSGSNVEITRAAAVGQHFQISDGTRTARLAIAGDNSIYVGTTTAHDFYITNNGVIKATATSTGFDVTGNTIITGAASAYAIRVTGNATAGQGALLELQNTTATTSVTDIWHYATTGDNAFIKFFTEGSPTQRGSITYNRAGGLTAYNTTSDYRSKDITGKYEASGETIDQLQVYMGKMKGATIARPMMIAHEAASVVPYAVTGEKDAEDEDGKPIYQSMDHQIFVPLLIAEVQALRSRVALLERN